MDPAPSSAWDDDGTPQFGTYRGELDALSFAAHSTVDRVRREKRWIWCGAFDEHVAVGLAVVQTGYAGNVFVWIYDRRRGEFLNDVSRVAPLRIVEVADWPTPRGDVARYRALVEGVTVRRDDDRWILEGGVGDVRLDLELVEAAEAVTAVCPVEDDADGAINVTRKQADARASGIVRSGTHSVRLDGYGFVDFSHGLLARETIWRWAIGRGDAGGRRVAFNLVAGFNDGLENVVWIEGEPRAVGPARIVVDGDGEWRVEADGVDLRLAEEATRARDLNLGLVVSEYEQPLGRWEGTIDGESFSGFGVAEYHRSVW